MIFIGIDFGSTNRPTGFCLADSKLEVECKVPYTDKEILEAVWVAAGKIAAIDAPLALPRDRHCLEEHCRGRVHFRTCYVECEGTYLLRSDLCACLLPGVYILPSD